MKKLALIAILTALLMSVAACGKDAQANAFMKEYESVTTEVAAKLDDDDFDGARKAFDSKKASLNAKWQSVKTGLPFQFSEATKKRMRTEPEKDLEAVVEAGNNAIKRNPKDEAKIQALALDLANVFRQ